ncbi:MAG: ribosome small subunit-dependent GTPase A [Clostridiales Family XIII bacterium]|jgi:ribosome biogenesis GTPase|nr:ribosome small subunit-dependent GTPase A [Clostridiales Family XIII bacterium]
MMLQGTIVKALSGFYYVEPDCASPDGIGARDGCHQTSFQCRARGIFKKEGRSPLVGDAVRFEPTEDIEVEGVVTDILPRRNAFVRPPIANIDVFVAVVSVRSPAPNLEVLDRFLATAEAQDTDALICVNKTDLGTAGRLVRVYGDIYPVLPVCAVTGEGIDALRARTKGRRAAFAGPSGVGKSSLINRLLGEGNVQTGEISARTGRGKHTTRHVEILKTEYGAELFDTPGYTSFEGVALEETEVSSLFPEFAAHAESCRFDDCRHADEPGCAVRSALSAGRIAESRYRSYVRMLEEARSRNAWEG